MKLVKETYAGHVGLEHHRQTSLQGIARKARRNQTHRFGNVYGLLHKGALRQAFHALKKKAAAGVDQVTAKAYAEDLEANIAHVEVQLKNKTYRAKLVRRVYIEKGNGKKRPLGIPAISEKMVQKASSDILESIYEADFLASSYGYRPNTGAQQAVKDLSQALSFGKFSYIVEADISGFFENIDHEWMLRMLSLRIADQSFLRLIRKWLKAGILDTDGKIKHPVTGCPQGGVISPILANIYLHYALDLWFEKTVKSRCEGQAYICRYADDFVCAFQYKREAQRFFGELGDRLKKFKLELSVEKTHILSFSRFRQEENTTFEFLGFEFRWGKSRKGEDTLKRRTSRSKLRKSCAAFKLWCKENRNNRIRHLIPKLNTKLRGYYNYYGLLGNYKSLEQFYRMVERILYKWLNRRSQRRSFNLLEFSSFIRRNGVLKPRIIESKHIQLQFDF